MINKDFWKGKKVFLTGHTGFKGSWLTIWLNELGAEVYGYALSPNTDPSLFKEAKISNLCHSTIGDIRDSFSLQRSIQLADPEIVIHMAAQPLVRKSYIDPVETYTTNILGSLNILEASRSCKNIKALINVTTDKVYENRELDIPFKEEDRLGGFDPYSNSKACSELITASYRSCFLKALGLKVVTARAGNVIGGGDWSEDRLIPDMIRAISNREKVLIRNPNAIRPWQHVLESLSGYLALAQYLFETNNDIEALNFGPGISDFMTVGEIVKFVQTELPHFEIQFDLKSSPLHEAQILKLDNSLALEKLAWSSKWNSKIAIRKSFEWYDDYLKGKDAYKLTLRQINEFCT